MLNLTSPLAGALGTGVTGWTAPTFGLTVGTSTFPNSKLWFVTSKAGGTIPASVTVHSASKPFSFLCTQPAVIRTQPTLNANGQLLNNPKNVYHVKGQIGVLALAGQPPEIMDVDIKFGVPAGAETADPTNVEAALIATIGAALQLVPGMVDTAKQGGI
jgi:hypothetical protein